MIGFFKQNLVLFFYGTGLLFLFVSLSGRIKIPLLFLVWLVPLVNVTQKLQQFPLGKDYVDILLIVLLLGWVIGSRRDRQPLLRPSPLNGISLAMILYTFAILLAGSTYLKLVFLWDITDPRVQAWKNYCVLPLLFYLVYNNIRDEKSVWQTVLVICFTMFVMDYYTLTQIRWFSSLVSRIKIKGTFVYLGPNEIAAFYSQYTVILMSLFLSIRNWKFKLPLLALIIINLNCLLFLFSRASYLSVFVGMFLLLLVKNKKLLVPLIIVGVLWTTALPEKVVERIESTRDEYGELDESSEERLLIWQRSIKLFNDNPLFGVGFGVFSQLGFELSDTHNIFLKILAEQGALGMVIFLLLIIILFFRGVMLYRKGEDEVSRGLGLGFAICIIVLCVNNFFGDRWTYLPLSSNLWVFAGLVERLNWLSAVKRKETRLEETKKYAKRYRPV